MNANLKYSPVDGIDIVSFVKFLYKGKNKFGPGRVINKLKEFDSYDHYQNEQRELKDRILNVIADAYQISPYTILHSKKRGKITQAKVMAMVLFNNYLDVRFKDIALMFGKKIASVRKRGSVFKKVDNYTRPAGGESTVLINGDAKIFFNMGFMEKYEQINNKIKSEPLGNDTDANIPLSGT